MNFFFILLTSFAYSAIIFEGDKPLETKMYEIGPSEYLQEMNSKVKMKCDVYPKLAIQTMMDPGLKGTSYKLVVRHKNESVKEVCSVKTKLRTFDIHSGEMPGMANNIMVVTGEEPLGDVDYLTFYDTTTAGTLGTLSFNASQPVTIKKSGTTLSVDYHAFLGGPRENCNILKDKKNVCLEKILLRNQVPNPKNFAAPDCSIAVKFNPKDAGEGSVDLFLEARVADVRKPKIEYTGKKITCSLAP
ncbi:MAG: hypothetical protein V4598_09130 [Bdellovibrionota bacterium]